MRRSVRSEDATRPRRIAIQCAGDQHEKRSRVSSRGCKAKACGPSAPILARGELWGEGLWRGGVALVLGNEARGLSPDVATQVEQNARLPIISKAESLNVAIAGGVLMYAWLRANL